MASWMWSASMITPQHYVVQGLHHIHPEVLYEGCMQGCYVLKHLARTFIFVGLVLVCSFWVMYAQWDFTPGAIMIVWGVVIGMLYMYNILQDLPVVSWGEPPNPGLPYEIENSANSGVFSLQNK